MSKGRQGVLAFDSSVSLALAESLKAAPRAPGYDYPVVLSADRALLLDKAGSWFQPSLHAWTSRLASIVPIQTLYDRPERRPVSKIIFLRDPSTISLDDLSGVIWQTKIVLHHMLLNGVVAYVEFVFDNETLDREFLAATNLSPDAVVVRSGCVTDQPTLYEKSKSPVRIVRSRDGASPIVARTFDFLFSRLNRGRRLYYDESTFIPNKLPSYWSTLRSFFHALQDQRCAVCWQLEALSELHLDHIYPRVQGGAHTLINLQLVHPSWNCRKGARLMGGVDQLARHAFMSYFEHGWTTPYYLEVLTNMTAKNVTEKAIRSYQQQSCRLLDLARIPV